MKKLLSVLIILLSVFMVSNTVMANSDKVVDIADVLTDGEEQSLEKDLNSLSKELGIDIVAVFTNEDIGYNEPRVAAADFYDFNSYGAGPSRSGIILYVNFYTRDYAIVSSGDAQYNELNERAVAYILDNFVGDYLSQGNYYEAVEDLLDGVDYVYRNADQFSEAASKREELLMKAGGSGLLAALIAMFRTGSLKSELKSRVKQYTAHQYIDPADCNISRSGDLYLYHTVTRTKISSGNSGTSRGSASSFSSSSGVSHTGGSRKF